MTEPGVEDLFYPKGYHAQALHTLSTGPEQSQCMVRTNYHNSTHSLARSHTQFSGTNDMPCPTLQDIQHYLLKIIHPTIICKFVSQSCKLFRPCWKKSHQGARRPSISLIACVLGGEDVPQGYLEGRGGSKRVARSHNLLHSSTV